MSCRSVLLFCLSDICLSKSFELVGHTNFRKVKQMWISIGSIWSAATRTRYMETRLTDDIAICRACHPMFLWMDSWLAHTHLFSIPCAVSIIIKFTVPSQRQRRIDTVHVTDSNSDNIFHFKQIHKAISLLLLTFFVFLFLAETSDRRRWKRDKN